MPARNRERAAGWLRPGRYWGGIFARFDFRLLHCTLLSGGRGACSSKGHISMKILKHTILLSLATALITGTTLAQQTYNGAICTANPANASGVTYFGGIENEGTIAGGLNVTCPTSTTASIGNARWVMRVTDPSTTAGFSSCQGFVFDDFGSVVATSNVASTTAAFTGSTVLTMSTTSGGFSLAFSHMVRCVMPPASGFNTSKIHRITLD